MDGMGIASFPRFVAFFSPVWWLLPFFPFDELCSHARRHPLGGCGSDARLTLWVLTGKKPANSGVWPKQGWLSGKSRCLSVSYRKLQNWTASFFQSFFWMEMNCNFPWYIYTYSRYVCWDPKIYLQMQFINQLYPVTKIPHLPTQPRGSDPANRPTQTFKMGTWKT